MAFLCPGDEAVVIEPAYDAYFGIVAMAGATARRVALTPPMDSGGGWTLDAAALAAAFGPKTRLVFLNSPLNPVGKVFTREELELIAKLCTLHDVIAVCDEVYEHMVFDGCPHIPLMTLPGMAERCVRIGSAGKTFSLTGWKVGYAAGAAPLIRAMGQAHQFLTFTTPPGLQIAVAYGLGKDDAYFAGLSAEMQSKRDRLAEGLDRAGFAVLPAEGTYFLTTDISRLSNEQDADFCKTITRQAGVAAIPVGAFYHPQSAPPPNYVRFCFSKRDEVLDEAAARLKAWTGG
jgi:aspartate/methionine/tyrosine aminotransferase